MWKSRNEKQERKTRKEKLKRKGKRSMGRPNTPAWCAARVSRRTARCVGAPNAGNMERRTNGGNQFAVTKFLATGSQVPLFATITLQVQKPLSNSSEGFFGSNLFEPKS
jgi:hypothetical protein